MCRRLVQSSAFLTRPWGLPGCVAPVAFALGGVAPFLLSDAWLANGDLRPLLQFIHAVHYHQLAGGQARFDNRIVPLGWANRHRLQIDRIVRLGQEDINRIRTALDRGGGDEDHIMQRVDTQPGVDEFVGKQLVVLIVEEPFELHGSGGWVDLIINGKQRAGGQLLRQVAVPGFHQQRVLGVQLLHHFWNVIFGKGENDGDRLNLRDDGQGIGVGSMNDIARIDQPKADTAGERGFDLAILNIELVCLDDAVVGVHRPLVLVDQSRLRVHLGFGDGIALLEKILIAHEIDLHLSEAPGRGSIAPAPA